MKVTVELRNDCASQWVPSKKLCSEWIRLALDTAGYNKDCSISLSFVGEKDASALNNQYRGIKKATNVLSFPSEFPADLSTLIEYQPLGDIIICPDVVKQESEKQNKELQAHWAHLTIHGLLHLLGHDHQQTDEAEAMEQIEISALENLGIPNPYLIGCRSNKSN